jgi:hypothetical protein
MLALISNFLGGGGDKCILLLSEAQQKWRLLSFVVIIHFGGRNIHDMPKHRTYVCTVRVFTQTMKTLSRDITRQR